MLSTEWSVEAIAELLLTIASIFFAIKSRMNGKSNLLKSEDKNTRNSITISTDSLLELERICQEIYDDTPVSRVMVLSGSNGTRAVDKITAILTFREHDNDGKIVGILSTGETKKYRGIPTDNAYKAMLYQIENSGPVFGTTETYEPGLLKSAYMEQGVNSFSIMFGVRIKHTKTTHQILYLSYVVHSDEALSFEDKTFLMSQHKRIVQHLNRA